MKISTKGRYAVRLMLDLATTNNWQSVYPSKNAPVPRPANPRPGRVYEEL